MSKGITKVLISCLAALLTVMPFSLRTLADYAWQFNITSYAAYELFQLYGFSEFSKAEDAQITCAVTNSSGTCTTWRYSSAGASSNLSIVSRYFPRFISPVRLTPSDPVVMPTAYDDVKRVRCTKKHQYLVYYSSINYTNPVAWAKTNDVQITRITNDNLSALSGSQYLIVLEFWSNTVPTTGTNKGYNFVTIKFPEPSIRVGYEVIPIFLGYADYMDDDLYFAVFNKHQELKVSDYQTHVLLEEGTPESENSVYDNDVQNNGLVYSSENIMMLEDQFIGDMSNNMNNIDFQGSDQFLDTGLLSTSAYWVKTQYNRMVDRNVIGDLISYALLFGLGLLIVGKMR